MILFELKRILEDIDNTFYDNIYGSAYFPKDDYYIWIKNELNARFGLIKYNKTRFKPSIYDAMTHQIDYTKSRIIYSEKTDYIYILIEANELFSDKEHFNYKIYDYCEQRLKNKTVERKFLYRCISNVHKQLVAGRKKNDLCRDILYYNSEKYILSELFLCEPLEKDRYDLNRMLSNLKKAYEEWKGIRRYDYYHLKEDTFTSQSMQKAIKAYTFLLAKEINLQWKKL